MTQTALRWMTESYIFGALGWVFGKPYEESDRLRHNGRTGE